MIAVTIAEIVNVHLRQNVAESKLVVSAAAVAIHGIEIVIITVVSATHGTVAIV
ncbi:hypothetical protein D3C72_2438390 [compost metagenome]